MEVSGERDFVPIAAEAEELEEGALEEFIPLSSVDAVADSEIQVRGENTGDGSSSSVRDLYPGNATFQEKGEGGGEEEEEEKKEEASSGSLLFANQEEFDANVAQINESHGKVKENDESVKIKDIAVRSNQAEFLDLQRNGDNYGEFIPFYERIDASETSFKGQNDDRADVEICQEMEVTLTSYEVKQDAQVLELQGIDENDEVVDLEDGDFTEENLAKEQVFQEDIGSRSDRVLEDFGTSDGRRRLKRSHSHPFNNTPSVQVVFNCLTSESKDKLRSLLRQWAEWHSIFVGSTEENDIHSLESGDEMYFPALQIGGERKKAVSFWMDKPSKHARMEVAVETTDITQRDVPLYDRAGIGALLSEDTEANIEGNLERIDEESRCFNCGSYSHAVRDCPRPRDHAAVNNARKLMQEKRGLANGSRTTSRYYQLSVGAKYDDLKPGIIGSETRQLLGIGDLDPPPWLNRMRELGYPPGYLEDQDEEPSGITIFGTDEDGADGICIGEDGEIIGEQKKRSSKKTMLVHFPGLNAPIPHDADKRNWGSSTDASGRYQGYSKDDEYSSSRDSGPRSSRGYSPDRGSSRKSSSRAHSPGREVRRSSPHLARTSSDSRRSPRDESYSLPPLGGSYPASRYSPMHRPYNSPSTPSQRSPYDRDYSDDGYVSGRGAWAKAQDMLRSSSRSRHSPSR